MTQSMKDQLQHQQPWTGLAYDIGDEIHILPLGQDDRQHDNSPDCHCAPDDGGLIWPMNFTKMEPPKHIWHHRVAGNKA